MCILLISVLFAGIAMALDTLDELALHCMETNGGVDTKNDRRSITLAELVNERELKRPH